jgi:hyperosmotically inducible periplasmic protein
MTLARCERTRRMIMNVRFSALLCLAGLAACSNKSQETAVNDPSYVDGQTQVAPQSNMQPASLESARSEPATTTTTPAPAERSTPTGSPLVADTKSTNTNDFKSTDRPEGTTKAPPGAAQPDNTKVNERDTNTATPTPGDQGNNATDLKITQQIRQAVMADGTLSFTAKNVKIITQNGKVTLRGPVKSEDERSRIEAAARKVAGAVQVDNQLEVKK